LFFSPLLEKEPGFLLTPITVPIPSVRWSVLVFAYSFKGASFFSGLTVCGFFLAPKPFQGLARARISETYPYDLGWFSFFFPSYRTPNLYSYPETKFTADIHSGRASSLPRG